MPRLAQAIVAVIAGTLGSGVAGGLVGAAVGWLAPSFVRWFHSPVTGTPPGMFDPVEFGLGLGIVCGLFLGAGSCLLLVIVLAIRDACLARAGLGVGEKPVPARREL